MKATAEIVIIKPIDEVFAVTARVENMDKWVDGVSDARQTSDGTYGVGTTLASKYTYGGKVHDITYLVTEYDPPHRHAMKSTSGPFPFEGVVTFESVRQGTKVTNTIDAGSDSFMTSVIFAVGGPIIRRFMRKQLLKELQLLKTYIEDN